MEDNKDDEYLFTLLFDLLGIVKGSCTTDAEMYEKAEKYIHKTDILKTLELMMPLKIKYENYLKGVRHNIDVYDSDSSSNDEKIY